MKRGFQFIKFSLVMAMFLFLGETIAQDGQVIFKKNCSSCHKIGGGKLVGPDLQGVTNRRSVEWLKQFIMASQDFIASGDPDAVAVYQEFDENVMPDATISPAELDILIAFLEEQSGGDDGAVAEVAENTEPEVVREATQEDIEMGAKLFSGEMALLNGGPSCVSCHNVNNDKIYAGGTLAKDLTGAYDRMGSSKMSLVAWLNSPPFPAMQLAYENKALDDEEKFQLAAFLEDVNANQNYNHSRTETIDNIMVFGGGVGMLLIFCIVSILWFNRKKQSTKQDIINRQLKSK